MFLQHLAFLLVILCVNSLESCLLRGQKCDEVPFSKMALSSGSECLEVCQTTLGCEFFTFQEKGECELYRCDAKTLTPCRGCSSAFVSTCKTYHCWTPNLKCLQVWIQRNPQWIILLLQSTIASFFSGQLMLMLSRLKKRVNDRFLSHTGYHVTY